MNVLWKEITDKFYNSNNEIKVKLLDGYNTELIDFLQINEQSVLGQIVCNCKGVFVDNYIRIFGNGDEVDTHNIKIHNMELAKYYGEGKLFIADDIYGGIYAINRGGFDNLTGVIWYYAPDTLEWESLDMSYPEFIAFISSNNLSEFYQEFKWNNFLNDISSVKFNEGILIYPFLWSEECDINTAAKKIVSFQELLTLNLEYMQKFSCEE